MDEKPKDNTGSSLFKKRAKFSVSRRHKRIQENEESSPDEGSTVVKIEHKRQRMCMVQSTKRVKVSQQTSNKSCGENDGDDDGEEESVMGESVSVMYKSCGSVRTGPGDMGATATLQIETELDRDARAIYERSMEFQKELKGKVDDKRYRGLNNYAHVYDKRDTAQGNAASSNVRKGPIRAPANLRATVRWDYQPDICKDYKETGFCGFGDSCKFLHDRSDYKHGWQLEREVQEGRYDKEDFSKYEVNSDDDDLPFKCYLCRKAFVNPVITKCRHYFCEKCALKQYKKTHRCFVCGQQTNGVFNPAKDLMAKISKSSQIGEDHKDDDDREWDEENLC